MPTLLESITKLSEEKEAEIKRWSEKCDAKNKLLASIMDESTRLRNENFRLKERLKKNSDKYRNLKMNRDLNSLHNKEVFVHSSQPYEIKGILRFVCENNGNCQYEVTDSEKNEIVGFWINSIQKIEDNKIHLSHRK